MKLATTAPEGFQATLELAWLIGIGEWDDNGKIQDVLCQAWVRQDLTEWKKVWVPVPRHYPMVEVEGVTTRYLVAAPGLPEGADGFPDATPIAELTPGIIRCCVEKLRRVTGDHAKAIVARVSDEHTSIALGKERFLVWHLRKGIDGL